MKKTKAEIGEGGLFDARQLGIPRMLLLGLQHTFAMFGATVLVPIITGLDVSTTLLMAGLGTLLFHFPLVKCHVNSHLFHLHLVGLPTGYRTVDGLSTPFPKQCPQFTHTAPAPARSAPWPVLRTHP